MLFARFSPTIRAALGALALMAGLFSRRRMPINCMAALRRMASTPRSIGRCPRIRKKAAEAAALAACRKGGGKDCKSLSWFSDSCMTYARNTSNDLFPGNSVSPEMAAKKAIRRCTAGSPNGKCWLTTMPLCVGPGYSAQDMEAARRATPAELEALSAKLNDREYWGAVAEKDSGDLTYSDGYPNEKDALNQLLEWDECTGCTKVLTYRDTCVGMAWAKGVKGAAPATPRSIRIRRRRAMRRATPAAPRAACPIAWRWCAARAALHQRLCRRGRKAN